MMMMVVVVVVMMRALASRRLPHGVVHRHGWGLDRHRGLRQRGSHRQQGDLHDPQCVPFKLRSTID
jgi:hypothetical protein